MGLLEQLTRARDTEKDGRVVRMLFILLALLAAGTFSGAARDYGCDRRTVAGW